MFNLKGFKLSPLHEQLISRTLKKPRALEIKNPSTSGWTRITPPDETFKVHHTALFKKPNA